MMFRQVALLVAALAVQSRPEGPALGHPEGLSVNGILLGDFSMGSADVPAESWWEFVRWREATSKP